MTIIGLIFEVNLEILVIISKGRMLPIKPPRYPAALDGVLVDWVVLGDADIAIAACLKSGGLAGF